MSVTGGAISDTDTRAVAGRLAILDGLRGIAIVLVVLSHLWTVYALPEDASKPLRVLLGSGNFAVNIFFVVGGYLTVSAMVERVTRTGRLSFGTLILRRWIRLSSLVLPLVAIALSLTSVLPAMREYAPHNTAESVWSLVTYTWSNYMEHNMLEARPDFGHLWYVCTDFWGVAIAAVVVWMFRRQRWALAVAFGALILVAMWYRQHEVQASGEFMTLIQTASRIDAIFWGALAGLAAPVVRSRRWDTHPWTALVLLALVPVMWWVHEVGTYLGFGGLVLNVLLAAAVVGIVSGPVPRAMTVVLERRTLTLLGRRSFALYIVHYPAFWYVGREYSESSTGFKVLVAILATVLISMAMTAVFEKPVQTWLRSPTWDRLNAIGLFGYVTETVRSLPHRVRERRSRAGAQSPTPPVTTPVPTDEL